MIRGCVLLATAALLAAADAPLLLRPDADGLAYDLAATAPWMPVLWDRCTLELPTSPGPVTISARLLPADGGSWSSDGTDLLAIREGHRVAVAGSAVSIMGPTIARVGTWSGGLGGEALRIDLPDGTTAEEALLACRQLHFANLGGVRALVDRRVGITVSCAGGSSSELPVDIAMSTGPTPPLLRIDDLAMAMDGAPSLRHQGWWSGRLTGDGVSWSLSDADPDLSVLSGDADITASLSAAQPLQRFATGQLLLAARRQGRLSLRYRVAGDGHERSVIQVITVGAALGAVAMLGDFPLQMRADGSFRLIAPDPNIVLLRCEPHPAGMRSGAEMPFTAIRDGEALLMRLVAPVGTTQLEGSAVFSNGTATCRMPYRIVIAQAVPQ